jgi:hypothetical protein
MLNFGAVASQKQILCPSRDFTFSHSQGQSRRFDRVQLTSGLTLQADIIADRRHVSVPVADVSIFVVVSQIARAFRRRVAGFPRADRDLEFWLQAESEINEEKRQ